MNNNEQQILPRRRITLSNQSGQNKSQSKQKKHSGHDNALFILKQTNERVMVEFLNGKKVVGKIVNFDNFTVTLKPIELSGNSEYEGEDTCFYKHGIFSFRKISEESAQKFLDTL